MKANLHPTWYNTAIVTCSCGNTFETGSTQETLTVDICSACHPFFTGEMRFVDRQGRVDRFMQKMQAAQARQAEQQAKLAQKTGKTSEDQGPAKSYQEILRDQQAKIKSAKKAA